MQSYGSPKLQKSQLWEFRDSHFGVLGQNDIWVLVSWPGTKYIIKGKVVVSPKLGPWWVWWVLWIRVCPCFVLTPKVFQLCTNQLVVWFCASLCEWVIVCPIPKLQHALLPPKCCELGSMPQLFTFLLFSPHTHIWVYQGASKCVKCELKTFIKVLTRLF
jgi:hypothetical protein